MIDHDKIIPIIEGYKRHFPEHWKDEKYKWEAVKHFQDNWDIEAENFGEMFKKATAKASNLLDSGHHYPRAMILNFAKSDDKATREMFAGLFDESRDLAERIKVFIKTAGELKEKYDDGTWNNHYQNTNAVSTYLWLKNPDKYYIYKYDIYRKCAEKLDDTYRPKGNGDAANVIGGYKMYDEIREILLADEDIREIFSSALTDTCYKDPEFVTAAIDFGYFLAKYYEESSAPKNKRYWLCAPGDGACIWEECIESGIIAIGWGYLGDYREYSSKQEITQALGKSKSMTALAAWQFLNEMKAGDVVFAKKGLHSVLGRGVVKSEYIYDPSRERYKNVRRVEWTDIKEVAYPGQATQKTLTDITNRKDIVDQLNSLYNNNHSADNLTDNANKHYWWLNANPRIWSFSDIAVGEVVSYTLYNENGNKRRIFQNLLDAKAGDMFIGYESNPVKQVVAIGRISVGQDGEKIYFEKVRDLKIPIDYAALHNCPELEKMEYFQNPQGSLFKLTKDEYDFILDMISTEDSAPFGAAYQPFTKADFLKEVFMTEGEYDRLRALVLRNKNVILQGAPGVGKTFSAKRLAYSIIGEKNKNRVCMVQFHQNYSYEDFIMGYRPNDSGGFDLQTGVFYDFCEKCKESSEPYFFIIDEINRGNLSKIFGELLMLIENDKRGEEHKINLVYGGKSFYIPENLHIIGMMNTADRSLAMIDYALRRRFCFYTMRPAFEDAQRNGFGEYTKNITCELYHKVIAKIKDLNAAIRADSALGRGFEIGHSYFAPADTSVIDDEWVRGVVEFEMIPLIEEYWFDDDKRVKEWTDTLRFALGESYDR